MKWLSNIKGSSLGTLACVSVFCWTMQFSYANETINQYYEQALIAFEQQDNGSALVHLKNILQQNDKHVPARVLLTQVYLQQGNGVAAEVELNRVDSDLVDDDHIISLFAHAYLLQKQYRKVIELTESTVFQSSIERDLKIFRGQALIGVHQYRAADVAFKQALAIDSQSQLALLGRAQIALQNKRVDLALNFVEQALSSDAPLANSWILKAKILQHQQQPNQALIAINQAITISPEHLSARLTRAMLLINLKQHNKAEQDIDYILAKIPNEPRAGYLKAILLATQTQDEQLSQTAIAQVMVTLAGVPDDVMKNTPDYYYLAGQVSYQFGRLDDARHYLTKFLNYAELEVNAVLMLASVELMQQQAETARSLLIKANINQPNDIRVLSLLGLAYLQQQNTDKAEYYFKQVLTMNPESSQGLTNLAKSNIQSGDYHGAIKALLSIKDDTISTTQVKLLLVDSYQQSKQYLDAIKVMESLLREFPENSYYYQRIGVLYGHNKQLELARSAFETAISLDDSNVLAMIHLARMDNISGNPAKALAFLQDKLKQFPKNTLIMAEVSDAYLLNNDHKNSMLWLKKAYALDKNSFLIVEKYAKALAREGELAQALLVTEAFVSSHSKHVASRLLVAKLYQTNKQYQQAADSLKDVLDHVANKAGIYVQIARVQLQAKNNTAAISSFKKAMVANEQYLPAYLGLLDIIMLQQDEKYALQLIATIKDISKDEGLAEVLQGKLYYQLHNYDLAEQHYLKALTIEPSKVAILGVYKSFKKQKQANKAITYLVSWLKAHGDDLQVSIALADCYRQSQQLQKSGQAYQQLLADFGELPILLNNYANVLYEQGEADLALHHARKAYSYLKNNVAIIDTLGWIESRMGNKEVALALFRQALTKDFDNAEVQYHLGATLYDLERHNEAQKYLKKSVNSRQDFSEKHKAKTLLARIQS